MIQGLQENLNLFSRFSEDENELCAKIEYEILTGAKNLVIYQSNCMKKISEIKKASKEKRSFYEEYLREREKLEKELEQKRLDNEEELDDVVAKKYGLKKEPLVGTRSIAIPINQGFTCAKSLLKNEPKSEIDPCAESNEEFDFKNNFVTALSLNAEHQSDSKIINSTRKSIKINDIDEKIKKPEAKKLKTPKKSLNLQSISIIVVSELTGLYKSRKFLDKVIGL